MPFYKISKLSLFFFLWCNLAFPQNYPVKNYTAANELPNNAIRSLFVDSNKILWIGTENGVVKKENDEFKYFFEEDGLALNSCWAIAEDTNNHLWFGSYGGGVSVYNGYDFEVISVKDGLVHNEITRLFSFGDYMYVGTSNGVSIIDIDNSKTYSLNNPAGNELLRVQDFFEFEKEIYIVTYNSGVFKIQQENCPPALVKINDRKNIYSVLVDNDNIYSSNKGFFTKTAVAEYVQEESPKPVKELGTSIIWDYVKTNDQKIFTAAWGIYDSDGGIYEVVDNKLISRAPDFNIPSKEVISLAYDPSFQRLYAGTKDAGLFEIALSPQIKFHSIDKTRVVGFSHTGKTTAFLLSDGILLRGDRREETITLTQLKEWQENFVSSTKLPLPRHRDDFYELDYTTKAKDIRFYDVKVSRDHFWVNTNVGLFVIKDTGELQRYLPLHTEEINFTQDGKLVETNPYGGVRIYSDINSLKYQYFNKEDPQIPTMVVSSLQKENKTYFVSVFSGLYVWENGEFRSYFTNGIWQENKLRHITTFGENIALSTEFGDIFIVNDDESFKLLKKIPRANINGNTISFLKEHNGTLLIGTEKGLTLYKNDRSILLDKEQGLEQPLLSAEVIGNRLLIGSNNGYYLVDPDAVTAAKALVDKVKIEEVHVNNNKFPAESLDIHKELNLEHNENTLLLKFNTNAHPYPHKLKYQYRLNSDEDWSLSSSRPEIFLPFLPASNYDIDVKVADESTGLTYVQPLLKLTILPPFWKTWWFILLMISLLLLMVYAFYQYEITQSRKFEEQKGLIQKRFEETKMEALLAQMNPHFIFNAMNSIQYYIVDSDIDKASVFLGDFAKLIRLNLDHCTKPAISLNEEIEYLQSYIRIENTRFDNSIQVMWEIDPSIDPYELEIPTMLLQTFVENVFVHAFPTRINNPVLKISFSLLPDQTLQCIIEDNGIGFSSESSNRLHKSKGVTLVKERLALLGYEIEKAVQIKSEKNKGTSVILQLQV